MAHEFIIMIDNKLHTFTEFESIPDTIQHVIKFLPEIPEEPHTEEQHAEIETWNAKLQELIEREHASSNSNR
jgi:hypothetical protein